MAVEWRILITLDEITGIQWECGACHAKFIVPISDKSFFPGKCPHCSDPWLVNGRTDYHQRFFNAISEFRNAMETISAGTDSVACVFSLEVKPALRDIRDPH